MKNHLSILIVLLVSAIPLGCSWDNDIYKKYVNTHDHKANLVPCPGFFYPQSADSPAYYELSTGICYDLSDIQNKTLPQNKEIISKERIHTIQGLQDYKICQIYQSDPDYYFKKKESPVELMFVGDYQDIDNYYKNFDYTWPNYDYSLIVNEHNNLSNTRLNKYSDTEQICPNDYPICTVYYAPQIMGLSYNYKYIDESYNIENNIIEQIVGNNNDERKKEITPYKFICTSQDNEFILKDICLNNEIICNDQCIDPLTNSNYCGAKGKCKNTNRDSSNYTGTKCGSLESCVDGQCQKNSSLVYCKFDNETYAYIDPSSNNSHCGAKGECNNSSSLSPDYEGVACNPPYEQCINGLCTTLMCFDNQMLCFEEGRYQCVNIDTINHCGKCDTSCIHPQSDEIVSSTCVKDKTDDNENANSYHCEYQCKPGYHPEGSNDNMPMTTPVACVQSVCDRKCEDNQICFEGKCLDKSHCSSDQCPVSETDCAHQSFLQCGEKCSDCRQNHALDGDCIDGICKISKCEFGYVLKTNSDNTTTCEHMTPEGEECKPESLAELGHHVLNAICENGQYRITECEKGFHFEKIDKTQRCVLNTNESCAPADSDIIMNCTEKRPENTSDSVFYSQHYLCHSISGEICGCTSEGNCEVVGCEDNYAIMIDNHEKQCRTYQDVTSCGHKFIDCKQATSFNEKNVNCVPYQTLNIDNDLVKNMPTLSWSDYVCHIDKCTTDAHLNGTSSSCRANSDYECGDLQQTCSPTEACKQIPNSEKKQCVLNGRTNITGCHEGKECSDGVNKNFVCKDDICQNPRIFDTQCGSDNVDMIDCLQYRLDLSDSSQVSIPTGKCKYYEDQLRLFSEGHGTPDRLVSGKWACECSQNRILCLVCDSQGNHLECHTPEECNQYAQQCFNNDHYPAYQFTESSENTEHTDDPAHQDSPVDPDGPVG